jgi:CheY-like chemotaxis protein
MYGLARRNSNLSMVNSWRALIADDSVMNKKMLKRLLEDYFRVVNAREACDGLEDIHAVEAAFTR